MQPVESEGKTVAEAVDAALHRMGLRRDQVEVHTLQEPSSGFMGLGAKPARVRRAPGPWSPVTTSTRSASGARPPGSNTAGHSSVNDAMRSGCLDMKPCRSAEPRPAKCALATPR